MNYYQFSPNDQMWNNWLLFDEQKQEPRLLVKDQYKRLVCPKCLKFDYDKAFKAGFDSEIRIRARGDFLESSDGFLCVSEKLKRLIYEQGVCGVSLKPAGKSGWHVVNVTIRVEADQQALKANKPICHSCKRPGSVTGSFYALRQIEVPPKRTAFFTTILERNGCDRDAFVTEDVLQMFIKGKFKGGEFHKLLTTEEEAHLTATAAKGKPRWPPHSKIFL